MFQIAAFSIGLLGSLHCVFMCSPIMTLFAFKGQSSLSQLGLRLLYQAGRIGGYILIGSIFYHFGRLLFVQSFHQIASITISLLLIGSLLWTSKKKIGFSQYVGKAIVFMRKKIIDSGIRNKGILQLIFGFINAWLPCGLVYLAVLQAMLLPDWTSNAIFMLFFGLGTLPLLFLALLGWQKLAKFPFLQTPKIKKIGLIGMAIFFLLQGFNFFQNPTESHSLISWCTGL